MSSKTPRQRALRQDAVENKRELIRAVGELLRENPEEATMPAVAERAGLSLTTAYRYFPTLGDLHKTFMLSVIAQLGEVTSLLKSSGTIRFKEILYHWMQVVDMYGPAMVRVRSREGFLTRYHAGESHTRAMEQVWGKAIRGMLAERDIPSHAFPLALTVFNALANSREVIDIREATGMDYTQAAKYFSKLYQAALEALKPEVS